MKETFLAVTADNTVIQLQLFVHSHTFNTSGLQGFELAKHKKLEKPLKTAGNCEIRTQIASVCQDT